MSLDTRKIVAKECRFAIHCNTYVDYKDDYHIVKEVIHYDNGDVEPYLKLVKDYLRPFFITKKGYQKYKDKKEYTELDKVIRYDVTQSSLRDSVAKALDKVWSKENLKKLSNSPYLYGSDLPSTSYIKKEYLDANSTHITDYSVAAFDIEFDVVTGVKQITMATITMGNKVFTAILRDFVKGIVDVEGRVERCQKKYLTKYEEKRKLISESKVYETEIDMVRAAIDKAHEWKPDFLAIWNIDYDIPRIIEACERAKVDPKDIFSDPNIPRQLRFFEYKQGQKKKVTASGKVTPIKPANQWHSVFTPASFYIIDAMCAYRHIRLAEPEERSYSLNAILTKELGIRKLEFEEADHLDGLKWHQFMQSNYKIEYIVYNRFDTIAMLELDEKINDLAVVLPLFAGISDFSKFNSQPKRCNDDLSMYCWAKGLVFGTTGSNMETDFDSETLDLSGWIRI